jgi:hypothetical protein
MKRSLVFAVAVFVGCVFVGKVLKAEAAAASVRPVAAAISDCDGSYWTAVAAATAASE